MFSENIFAEIPHSIKNFDKISKKWYELLDKNQIDLQFKQVIDNNIETKKTEENRLQNKLKSKKERKKYQKSNH